MQSLVTRSTLRDLLPLIDEGNFKEAATQWREWQVDRNLCHERCPYGEGTMIERCALCLEGRLRAVALVSAERDDVGQCPYGVRATAIHDWLNEIRLIANNHLRPNAA